MKAVSKRIREKNVNYFRFELREEKRVYRSRYALTGRVWLAIVSGIKANEFDSLDQLDSTIFALALICRWADGKNRQSGFVIEKGVKS